ncbi:MAG: carboxypeptidase-like regulatory domain-containing protein [Planctomycetota bacterium]
MKHLSVEAHHPSYVLLAQTVAVEHDGPRASPVVRLALRPGQAVSGRVIDAAGKPVPHARVRYETWSDLLGNDTVLGVTPEEMPVGATVASDAEGRFELHCVDVDEPGGWVTAEAEGRVGPWVSLAAGLAEADVLTLPCWSTCSASGVVRLATGDPVVGARVTFAADDAYWGFVGPPIAPHATTDAEGRFRGDPLVPWTLRVSVEPMPQVGGYADAPFQHYVQALVPGEHRGGLLLTVPGTYVFDVHLSDANGKPLPRESVGIRRPGEVGACEFCIWTQEDGRARFLLDDPGPWDVVRMLPRSEDVLKGAVLLPAEPLSVTLSPTPARTVELRVADALGQPVDSFSALVSTTDLGGLNQGFYDQLSVQTTEGIALVRLPEGVPFDVEVACDAGQAGAHYRALPLDGQLLVRLLGDRLPRGRVIDRDGRPVSGAKVSLQIDGKPPLTEEVVTDDDGHFVCLSDAGDQELVTLWVDPPAPYMSSSSGSYAMRRRPWTLRLAVAGRLEGRLVGPPGVDLGGIQVLALARGVLGLYTDTSCTTDAEGVFRFDSFQQGWNRLIAPDSIELAARDLACAVAPLPASSSDRMVEIPILHALRLSGRVEGPCVEDSSLEIRAWAHAQLMREPIRSAVGEDGGFELRGLAPGAYRVSLWSSDDDEIQLAAVDATAGDEGVLLRCPDRASLSILLPHAEGEWQLDAWDEETGAHVIRTWLDEVAEADVSVVADRMYVVRVSTDDGLDLVGTARGRPGDVLRPGAASGLPVRIKLVGRAPYGGGLLMLRSPGSWHCLEQDMGGRWSSWVPNGTYDLVLVEADRPIRNAETGLRPDGKPA